MVGTVTSKPAPRVEPDWSRFMEAVDAGVIRLTADQRRYVESRVSGADHNVTAAVMGLKKFPGYRLRGRLIDGWEKLERLLASGVQDATA